MKNILLAVIGLTPQVITETLFALHQQGRKVDAIHVITTRQGKEQINAHLLSPKDGKYYSYLAEYQIDRHSINFGYDSIHTVKDPHGIEIDDITGEEENEWLLKCCLEWAFKLTRDPASAVFFSVAGGRKTMSACLMVAAQFYGRPQDRVFHVLVTPEFESNRDFYYPPRISTAIELMDRQGRPYIRETKYAAITLVPLPFVSIRDQLSDHMLLRPRDPASLLLSLVREEQALLVIDLPQRKVIYKNREIDMIPSHLALYAFFAKQKRDCTKVNSTCRHCTECYLDVLHVMDRQAQITELYRRINSGRDFVEMSDTGIMSLNKTNFRSYKSKIKKVIQQSFGLTALTEVGIEGIGKKPDTRHGLRIDRERIRIIS